MTAVSAEQALARLLALRQHSHQGQRSPHKPLLALLALSRFEETGESRLAWSEVEQRLGGLIATFGPASKTQPAQGAAYPFTRLRSDGVWRLEPDVEMDSLGALRREQVTGRLEHEVEMALRTNPQRVPELARQLVESQFP